MDPISKLMREHYSATFQAHGPTSEGVDWGPHASRMLMRFEKMLAVIEKDAPKKASLLDVGCGYGGLLQYVRDAKHDLDYCGIDVAENMIRWAAENLEDGRFICGDVLEHRLDPYDYVVCSGILTQKLSASVADMDLFAGRLIRRMFALCRRGIAFNVMTTKVNFFADNLYYRNPAEMLAWCMTEVSRHVRLDHAYPLHEYTVYLYRDGGQR